MFDKVMEYYDSIGGSARRPILDESTLERKDVLDSISHGVGRDKDVVFKVISEVLKEEYIIDHGNNGKIEVMTQL